jgi:hypothetical protein
MKKKFMSKKKKTGICNLLHKSLMNILNNRDRKTEPKETPESATKDE